MHKKIKTAITKQNDRGKVYYWRDMYRKIIKGRNKILLKQ